MTKTKFSVLFDSNRLQYKEKQLQIGSCIWDRFSGALDYGLQKLDEGAACLSRATLEAAYKILQAQPDSLFKHRYAPRFHSAVRWVEDNPQTINQIVNISVIAFTFVQGELSLHTITFLLQLLIQNDKEYPISNRLLTLINAISIYQVGVSHLSCTNLIVCSSLLHNICHNSFMIKYTDDEVDSKTFRIERVSRLA